MSGLVRIILHWTAGGRAVSAIDREHYHWIVPQDGEPVQGSHAVTANIAPIRGSYAAHTLNCNSGSIGVSACGMRDAIEAPFAHGPDPLTQPQIDRMMHLVGQLCRAHGIPVTRKTVLTHAEVQPTLGIAQRGKWDIRWLPGMAKPGSAVEVGDILRAMVRP